MWIRTKTVSDQQRLRSCDNLDECWYGCRIGDGEEAMNKSKYLFTKRFEFEASDDAEAREIANAFDYAKNLNIHVVD